MPIPPLTPVTPGTQMSGMDLIKSSMRLIGVLGSGEVPTSDEANDALAILNQMIDEWTAQRMLIFTLVISEFPLTVGQQTYTLGSGGNFDVARPARIERMSIVNLNNPAMPLELPLEMLTDQEWQAIPVKLVQSALPTKVYDDGAFPFRNLSFWCIPTVQVNTRIYGWSSLTQFPDLVTAVTFPPAYYKALRYNLAVDLAPEYGTTPPVEVIAQAQSSKAAIKAMNTPILPMTVDAALVGHGGKRAYNWITDLPATR